MLGQLVSVRQLIRRHVLMVRHVMGRQFVRVGQM